MFRRLLPLLLVPLALSACSPDSSEPSGSSNPSESQSATDQALVGWLDEYCGLPAFVTQDVRAAFAPASVPDPTTEADRAPLVASLTAADEGLAEVGAALLEAPNCAAAAEAFQLG